MGAAVLNDFGDFGVILPDQLNGHSANLTWRGEIYILSLLEVIFKKANFFQFAFESASGKKRRKTGL